MTDRGEGLTSRAGLWWLAEVADQLGLTGGLRQAMRRFSWRDHHPGTTLAVMILALADGATTLSDMAMLRGLRSLFGPVASTTTLWRTINRIGPAELRDLVSAETGARAAAWALERVRDRIVIDIDATIVTTRSDKQDAAGTWKRSYGFHPLIAIDVERREVLAQLVRPGNAGSNTAVDHVQVLGAAIEALPKRDRAGHHWDDDRGDVVTEIVIRTDAGGQTHWLAEECSERNCGFSLGYSIDDRVRTGVMMTADEDWTPAIEADGSRRDGAQVIDLTQRVNLDNWPEGTRLIVRRERPHPGAQLSLFDDIEGMRCIVNNQTWALLSAMAFNLVSRAQRLTLTGSYQRATPKTIRQRLLHVAGRITPTGRRLHLDQDWPWTPTLITGINNTETHTDRHAA